MLPLTSKTSRQLLLLFFLLTHFARGQGFEPLGGGLRISGQVYAMEYDSLTGRMFVGGKFSQINNVQCENIGWYDATGWHSFGRGTEGVIQSMEMMDGKLYAGGLFESIDSVAVTNLASWDGNTWSVVGPGVSGGRIYSVVYFDSALYVSGTISNAGGIPVNGIAKWDGSNWSAVGSGPDVSGVSMKVLANNLYVYGLFKNFNGMPADQIISYDGTTWTPQSITDTNYTVHNITYFNNKLCASVYSALDYKWRIILKNTNSWSTLTNNLKSSNYYPLTSWNDTLYFFESDYYMYPDTISVTKITSAGIKVQTYASPEDPSGINLGWYFAEPLNNNLYIGGSFIKVGGARASGVAKLNGNMVSSPFHTSVGYADSWYNAAGFAMYNDSSTQSLYVGGRFEFAGDTMASNVARWDGTTWHPMGAGFYDSTNSVIVRSIVKFQNQLYAAGRFKYSGNKAVNSIARWTGTSWDSIGLGTNSNGIIREMAIYNNELYVCGNFTSFNGMFNTDGIVKYNGTTWSAISGLNITGSTINSVCVHDNKLYISGSFNIGGVNHRIAVYDGTSWTSLPLYPGWPPTRMASVNGFLYAADDDRVNKFDTTWIAVHPTPGTTGYGFHPNSIKNQFLVGDNDANRTYIMNPSGTIVPFCYNIVYNTEEADSIYTYLTGFLPEQFITGKNFNNIVRVKAENPVAQVITNTDTICDHQYVYFSTPPSDLIHQFEWSFPGGVPSVSTSSTPVIKYNVPGDYDVYMKISNGFGFDSTLIVNRIHVNNCTLGVEELENSFSVFPNPVKDFLTVKWDGASEVQHMELFDLSGRSVGAYKMPGSGETEFQLNCSELNPGMYLVSIRYKENNLIKKIIKY